MTKSKPQIKREVKSVRINHGVFGHAHTRNIQRSIEKWGNKGYSLQQQNDIKGGCAGGGYTLITFIRESE